MTSLLLRVALLSAAGLASTTAGASSASADELGFGLSFGGHHGTRGFVGVRLGEPSRGGYVVGGGGSARVSGFGSYGFSGGPTHTWTRPVGYPVYEPAYTQPVYQPAYSNPVQAEPFPSTDDTCRQVYLPPTTTFREQVVYDPPVFETRRMPVFRDERVPVFGFRFDVRLGRSIRVSVGERIERVQVGFRDESVLVRPATSHVVRVPETIPGRMVWICDDSARRHLDGEVMSEAEYRALLPNAPTFSAPR